MDVVVGRRGDPGQDGIGIVVTGLDALEVEDRQATEAGQLGGQADVDDGVHRRGDDRDGQVDPAQDLVEADVVGLDRARAGRQRDVLEAVRRPDRVDLRVEDPALGRLTRGGDHQGIDGCTQSRLRRARASASRRQPAVYQPAGRDQPVRRRPSRLELEPGRPVGVDQVGLDPPDRVAIGRPDDDLERRGGCDPAQRIVLVRQGRLAAGWDPDGKDRRGQDPFDARLVELVDLVEVEEALDRRPVEAGLLVQLAQGSADDRFAGLERARDALPQAGQDPARRAAQQEDLDRVRPRLRRAGATEDPDVDQVRPDQSRSNRSTGRTKTVAPPTSTSSG